MLSIERWQKSQTLIPIALFIACLVLMTISSLSTHWATIQDGSEVYHMGLWSCKDCGGPYKTWDWKCFSVFTCISPQNLKNCLEFTAGAKASNAYIGLELFAFISGLLLIEKLLLSYWNKHYISNSVYLLSSLMSISHLIGYLYWRYLINEELIPDERASLSASLHLASRDGSIIAVTCIFLSFFSIIALVLSMKMQKKASLSTCLDTISLDAPVTRFSMKYWMHRVGVLLAAGICLIGIILYYGRWVLRFTGNSYWEGGLATCKDCDENIINLNWNCLESISCVDETATGSCELYTNLSSAFKGFAICEIIAAVFLVFFLQTYTKILMGKNYGFPVMNYLYAIGVSFFNLLATFFWFYLSGASLTTDCQREAQQNELPPVCLTFGPFGLLFSNIFLIPMSIIFCYAYYHREVRIELMTPERKPLGDERSQTDFDRIQSNSDN
ncbi:unnamed protein product [Blepharisma stoltei]|uniref:Uncharacterized protein n=1 Tax=Blepharisma stoltei TaxID=1481888 RepID=A0AAU9IM81_9CILI|nr:unnamed protein product [Blepharisma stoltei]